MTNTTEFQRFKAWCFMVGVKPSDARSLSTYMTIKGVRFQWMNKEN